MHILEKISNILNEETHEIGDKVRIVQARTSGGKTFDIVITKLLDRKGKVEGQILSGSLAGDTVKGKIVKVLD